MGRVVVFCRYGFHECKTAIALREAGFDAKYMRPERGERHKERKARTMHQEITAMSVRPWTLNGVTERLIVPPMQCHGGLRCG